MTVKPPTRPVVTCKAADCTRTLYSKGLCKKHYTQVLRHGKLTPELERGQPRICPVKDCGRSDTVRGYCRKHARQLLIHGRLTPEREHMMGRTGCEEKGCDGVYRAMGLCAKHYNQRRWAKIVAAKNKAPQKKARATAK